MLQPASVPPLDSLGETKQGVVIEIVSMWF